MSHPIASAWDLTGGAHVAGLTQVGEVTSRTMKEAVVEPDFKHAWGAGYHKALEDVASWTQARIAEAGEYDDTRALVSFQTWVADRIREVHLPQATTGNHNA